MTKGLRCSVEEKEALSTGSGAVCPSSPVRAGRLHGGWPEVLLGRNDVARSRSASGARLVNRRAGGLMALDVGIREIVSLEKKRLIESARQRV